jgi:hypothetical protein
MIQKCDLQRLVKLFWEIPMSDSEQDAALLRFIRERSEAKKRRALLYSELRIAAANFVLVGEAIKRMNTGSSLTSSTPDDIIGQIDKAPDICGFAKIKDMLIELRDVQFSLSEFDRQAVELSVD